LPAIHYPRWLAPITWTVGVLLVHVALPYWLSTLSHRYGWSAGGPGALNLFGLILVLGGVLVVALSAAEHFKSAPRGWDLKATPFDPSDYLIVSGPYAHSRNPLYLGELAMWKGWTLFYGSVTVLAATLLLWATVKFVIVPYEERKLTAERGEAYLRYQAEVPRWFRFRLS